LEESSSLAALRDSVSRAVSKEERFAALLYLGRGGEERKGNIKPATSLHFSEGKKGGEKVTPQGLSRQKEKAEPLSPVWL